MLIVALEAFVFHLLGIPFEQLRNSLVTMELLSILFGAYFWFAIKERLPTYYDENKINAYSDGIFRMNLPGIYLNNSNWPHIVRAGRVWSLLSAVALPMLYLAGDLLFSDFWNTGGPWVLLLIFLSSLFLPLYIAAKRCE